MKEKDSCINEWLMTTLDSEQVRKESNAVGNPNCIVKQFDWTDRTLRMFHGVRNANPNASVWIGIKTGKVGEKLTIFGRILGVSNYGCDFLRVESKLVSNDRIVVSKEKDVEHAHFSDCSENTMDVLEDVIVASQKAEHVYVGNNVL